MPDGLTFQIHPEGESTSLDLFVRVLEDVRKLVIEVDYAVNRQRSGKRWAVTRLHSSLSPTITIDTGHYRRLGSISRYGRSCCNGNRRNRAGNRTARRSILHTRIVFAATLRRCSDHFQGPDKASRISVSPHGESGVIRLYPSSPSSPSLSGSNSRELGWGGHRLEPEEMLRIASELASGGNRHLRGRPMTSRPEDRSEPRSNLRPVSQDWPSWRGRRSQPAESLQKPEIRHCLDAHRPGPRPPDSANSRMPANSQPSGSSPQGPDSSAQTFVTMQALRHEADYEDYSRFTRNQVRTWIEEAERAIAMVDI